MGEIFALPGQSILLVAQLSDGEESFPIIVKSLLKDPGGNLLSTETLNHVGNGLFVKSVIMPDFSYVTAQQIAYEADGLTMADYDLGVRIFGPNGGLDPSDIWNHPDRTLTEEVQIDTSEVMNEIKAELDNRDNYICMMSSVLNNTTGVQTLICYLNKNGQTLAAVSNARVSVHEDNGAQVWAGTADTADARGVFKVVKTNAEPMFSRDKVYYVVVTITHNSKDYSTTQTFFTVG